MRARGSDSIICQVFSEVGDQRRSGGLPRCSGSGRREIRHQAFLLGFSAHGCRAECWLGLGLAAVWFVRRASQVPAEGKAMSN
jgi:hypothetical protein